MIVLNQKIDDYTIKVFSTKIGYHYKIYKEKTVIAQSYVYYHRMDDCYKRLWADLELLNITEEEYDNLSRTSRI